MDKNLLAIEKLIDKYARLVSVLVKSSGGVMVISKKEFMLAKPSFKVESLPDTEHVVIKSI